MGGRGRGRLIQLLPQIDRSSHFTSVPLVPLLLSGLHFGAVIVSSYSSAAGILQYQFQLRLLTATTFKKTKNCGEKRWKSYPVKSHIRLSQKPLFTLLLYSATENLIYAQILLATWVTRICSVLFFLCVASLGL